MSSQCIFEVEHPCKVYFSGETLSGRVILQTIKPKVVKLVYLLFEGLVKIHWKEESQTFQSEEIIIKDRTDIFSEGQLPAGNHIYAFSIPLPAKCPTSCTEKYGEISYVLSLHIERETRYHNRFWQPITVIKPLDLNCNSKYLTPIQAEDIKYTCCFPCSSGPIISTLSLPYSAWAPGQDIRYVLKINNRSKIDSVQGAKLYFVQTFLFRCKKDQENFYVHTENYLDRLHLENRMIPPRTEHEFKGRLRAPSVPPSTLSDEGNIQISYRIGVEILTGDCHMNSYIWLPITIGTIPLIQSLTSDIGDMNAFSTQLISADMPPSYDMCMPTSYLRPTLIGQKFKDTEMDKFYPFAHWLPKYPVYNSDNEQFADDLSIQIAGLQKLAQPQMNLFQSEIEPSAPEMFDAACEKCNNVESNPSVYSDYETKIASSIEHFNEPSP